MQEILEQLKPLIIRSLRLEDLRPEDMCDDQPLMGGDLEIDSIDILQLVVEIERHFGIRLVSGKFDREAWENLRTLAAAIEARLAEAGKV